MARLASMLSHMVRRRHDVEDGEPLDPAGMIQRQPIGNPRAPVVPHSREADMAELFHDLDDIRRHGALRIDLGGSFFSRFPARWTSHSRAGPWRRP